MMTRTPSSPSSKVRHLHRDGRLTTRANGVAWRVVSADRDRVDPFADYLFCAPDFLFPVDASARALRLEAVAGPAARSRNGRRSS